MCFEDEAEVPWAESDRVEAYLATVGTDEVQRRFVTDLHRDGAAVIDLGPEGLALCDQVIAETETYFAGGARRAQDAWRRSPTVRALSTLPIVEDRLRLAYGREPFAFQTLNFHRGSEQKAHSDAIHFHSEPQRFMCGVWFALEDVAADAGPLFFHPGSHRRPVLDMREAGITDRAPTAEEYESHYEPAFARTLDGEPRLALLKKGQALVWVANLAHGGLAIAREGATRRSLVAHYYFENCLYFTPRYSDAERGRLYLRLPSNLRTGGWVWPRRDGKRAPVSVRALAGFIGRTMLRSVRVS